jgi:hypothetical protein
MRFPLLSYRERDGGREEIEMLSEMEMEMETEIAEGRWKIG